VNEFFAFCFTIVIALHRTYLPQNQSNRKCYAIQTHCIKLAAAYVIVF